VAGDRLVQAKVIFKESLTKSLNREAVATQSPGLRALAATLEKSIDPVSNPDLSGLRRFFSPRDLFVPRSVWRNPVGVGSLVRPSQGSRQSSATLGSGSQPLCGLRP